MTKLERRCRLLMLSYPAAYRRERADEMLGTLLDTTPPGRTWPLARDARALLAGGLRARGPLYRRPAAATDLRLAALLGAAIYLSLTVYRRGYAPLPPWRQEWPELLTTALALVTVLVAMRARRRLLAAVAAVGAGAVDVVQAGHSYPAMLVQLSTLAALVLLSGRHERVPLLWLCLPGVLFVAPWLATLALYLRVDRYVVFLSQSGQLALAMVVVVAAWILFDPRPAVAMAIASVVAFGAGMITVLSTVLQYTTHLHTWVRLYWSVEWPSLAVALGLGVLGIWRIRRRVVL